MKIQAMTPGDDAIRAYLLGRASEADAERLEVRLIEDEDVFSSIRGVEDDLFDEYARGTLAPVERQGFLDRYGAARGRLLLAHALARRPAGRHSRWVFGGVAAALVAGVGFSVWSRQRPAQSAAVPVRGAIRSPLPAAVVAVNLGSSRSRTEVPEIAIPASARVVELHVRLDPADRFDGYSMELRSPSGTLVWHADNLHASNERGDLVLVGAPASDVLATGSYELAVRGTTPGAPQDALGFATLSMRR
jgi:hypothetical protein